MRRERNSALTQHNEMFNSFSTGRSVRFSDTCSSRSISCSSMCIEVRSDSPSPTASLRSCRSIKSPFHHRWP